MAKSSTKRASAQIRMAGGPFQAFMDRTMQPVDTAEQESIEEKRAKWADEVWHSISRTNRYALAMMMQKNAGWFETRVGGSRA